MSPSANQPLGGNEMPRFAGPATMMRLANVTSAKIIERAYDEILSHDCIPLTLGGDHTIAPLMAEVRDQPARTCCSRCSASCRASSIAEEALKSP